jgi:hypothetical protein
MACSNPWSFLSMFKHAFKSFIRRLAREEAEKLIEKQVKVAIKNIAPPPLGS